MNFNKIALRIAKDISLSDVSKAVNEAMAELDEKVHENLESKAKAELENKQKEMEEADSKAHEAIMKGLESELKKLKTKL